MSAEKKYKTLIVSTVVMVVYLCLTEVYGRWSETIALSVEFAHREEVPDLEMLEQARSELLQRKKTLLVAVVDKSGRYEQTETGLFEFLSEQGQSAGIRYGSLVPEESEPKGELTEVGFNIEFSSDFHRMGKWLNSLESGPIPTHISMVRISSENALSDKLNATVKGRAHIFHGAGRQ